MYLKTKGTDSFCDSLDNSVATHEEVGNYVAMTENKKSSGPCEISNQFKFAVPNVVASLTHFFLNCVLSNMSSLQIFHKSKRYSCTETQGSSPS